jgi:plasmid stability protein
MATLTVRNVPEDVHKALRLSAAANGRSVEAEVRARLAESVREPAKGVAERAATLDAEGRPSAIGLWADVPYPEGRLVSEDYRASQYLEAAWEGEEITREEFAELNDRLDKFEIDGAWILNFLARRRREQG